MKEYTRDKVVEELTNFEFDSIDWDVVAYILEHGCKGYANFTNQELIEEWEFLFEEDIVIK